MSITTIKSGIESRLDISIPNYSKLSYQINIEDNKFKGNSAGYSVLPNSASEQDGLLGAVTLDHSFNITLTNSYNAGAKSQIGDELKTSRIAELQDDLRTVYRDLVVNKSGIDASILLVSQLDISEPEFIEESSVIFIKATVTIKYKTNL